MDASSIPEHDGTLTFEAHIRSKILAHLGSLGLLGTELSSEESGKERIRALHGPQRRELLLRERGFLQRECDRLSLHFANGAQVDPTRIQPRLELVSAGTWQARLFHFAGLLWSVPVSQGYGRRIRFLVWDGQNDKLLGLIALGDPVFNLKVRDTEIGWDVHARRERLAGVMDAYVLGAMPPYNKLLGGKLVAALLRTDEIRAVFERKYSTRVGLISGKAKGATLALVTTSSALGRSSVYNRIALHGTKYLRSVGFTAGWGHFHVPNELFRLLRTYLSAKDHAYTSNNRFGDGPNWKMRATRQAFAMLGLDPGLLRHGIRREVFFCPLARNAHAVLREAADPDYTGLLTVQQVGAAAVARWLAPRAVRDSSYLTWHTGLLRPMLMPNFVEERSHVAG